MEKENNKNKVSYTRAYLNLSEEKKKEYIEYIKKDLEKSNLGKYILSDLKFLRWKTIFHHATVNLGPIKSKYELGKEINLVVDSIGIVNNDNHKAIALKVINMSKDSDIEQPHITLMIRKDGGKPVHSNYIKNWVKLSNRMIFPSTIEEFEYGSDKPKKRERKVQSSLEKHYEEHKSGIDSIEMNF